MKIIKSILKRIAASILIIALVPFLVVAMLLTAVLVLTPIVDVNFN